MSGMKLLRTIRLDPSDTFVFARAAEAGEWAVPGSFMFLEANIEALGPKERSAFRSGFLGVGSFGWSTLAIVTPVTARERAALVTAFAEALIREHHPAQTLVALHRSIEGGEVKERFRTLLPRAEALGPDAPRGGFRAFDFFEVEGEEGGVSEEVDLLAMMKDKTP
ncbi:MAG: DUF6505 family protein [Hyphomicrobiales bacterium]|nr:DUF6505 family protein [Hyphomicrobiales bacterium]